MDRLQKLAARVAELAARIGAPADSLPTFGVRADGDRAQVEWLGGAYHHVFFDRGIEVHRQSTPDAEQMLVWIFHVVTRQMATAHELAHRQPGRDWRRLADPYQIDAMSRLGATFDEHARRSVERSLRRAPYDDERYGV